LDRFDDVGVLVNVHRGFSDESFAKVFPRSE